LSALLRTIARALDRHEPATARDPPMELYPLDREHRLLADRLGITEREREILAAPWPELRPLPPPDGFCYACRKPVASKTKPRRTCGAPECVRVYKRDNDRRDAIHRKQVALEEDWRRDRIVELFNRELVGPSPIVFAGDGWITTSGSVRRFSRELRAPAKKSPSTVWIPTRGHGPWIRPDERETGKIRQIPRVRTRDDGTGAYEIFRPGELRWTRITRAAEPMAPDHADLYGNPTPSTWSGGSEDFVPPQAKKITTELGSRVPLWELARDRSLERESFAALRVLRRVARIDTLSKRDGYGLSAAHVEESGEWTPDAAEVASWSAKVDEAERAGVPLSERDYRRLTRRDPVTGAWGPE
jgi:hypothetical protein